MVSTASLIYGIKHARNHFYDPNQKRIALPLQPYPFRLRAGDVIRTGGGLCRAIRVNECAAVPYEPPGPPVYHAL